ncbi:type II toxin-antitoxin system VapC family toxin [Phycicoccus sp.]|uniref:type II toxin-antitoxin system VapC family toxin n=1 Tax=Phycicoccus sp. TaxID=1902410 RepID=UPI002CC1FFEA|nr:type II toxin-antitoxin system VapC family toxin [Phycicoccus sp.]HMM96284.1 type II toxin-antitoxin system VapC family toxin [Phycicoccus sp.]
MDDLVARLGLVVEPVTAEQGAIARAAHRDYGRGSGPPARLDFGDCFAHALARATGDPILFKGDDFGRTDLTPQCPPADTRRAHATTTPSGWGSS